jgi:hypothetical protein
MMISDGISKGEVTDLWNDNSKEFEKVIYHQNDFGEYGLPNPLGGCCRASL